MSEFKVGDRIRWTRTTGVVREGNLGTVTHIGERHGGAVYADVDGKQGAWLWAGEGAKRIEKVETASDDVNHPKHYTQYPVEVIEITERLSFLMGNIVKYVLRADHKGEPLKDLRKAEWYLRREIARRERESQGTK